MTADGPAPDAGAPEFLTEDVLLESYQLGFVGGGRRA
jgi:hypothetical protein